MGFLLDLALTGRGIFLAPSFVLEDSLEAGRLVPVLPDWHERSLPLHALWPHRTLMPAKVRAFLDFLSSWFADGTGTIATASSTGKSGKTNQGSMTA